MAFPWGSLISTAGSLFGGALSGGLFGGGSGAEGGGAKKAKHHALDYDRRRIKALVDGAGDAGIHPLVALGASSGGGFASPVGTEGGFGFGDAIARGMETLGEYYEQDQDRAERDEQRKYDRDQDERRQMDKIADDLVRSKSEDQAIKESNARIMEHTANARAANARAAAVGAARTMNTLVGPGFTASPPPGRATAQEGEDQYGEIGDLLYGGSGFLDDLVNGRVEAEPTYIGRLEKQWNNWLYKKSGGRFGYQ